MRACGEREEEKASNDFEDEFYRIYFFDYETCISYK